MTTQPTETNPGTPNFEPCFTQDQVFETDGRYETTWGASRRTMLTVLAKSPEEITGILNEATKADETVEVYFQMIKEIDQYAGHLKNMLELADAAQARLLWVANAAVETKGGAQ